MCDFYRNSEGDTQAGWTNQQQAGLQRSELPLFTTITSSSLHCGLCGDQQQNFRLSDDIVTALPLIVCFHTKSKFAVVAPEGLMVPFVNLSL